MRWFTTIEREACDEMQRRHCLKPPRRWHSVCLQTAAAAATTIFTAPFPFAMAFFNLPYPAPHVDKMRLCHPSLLRVFESVHSGKDLCFFVTEASWVIPRNPKGKKLPCLFLVYSHKVIFYMYVHKHRCVIYYINIYIYIYAFHLQFFCFESKKHLALFHV